LRGLGSGDAEDPAVNSGIDQFLDDAEELVTEWEQEAQ
jgi:hypothetical protein